VLLRVQLGCELLSEGFCDLRRHCQQVSCLLLPGMGAKETNKAAPLHSCASVRMVLRACLQGRARCLPILIHPMLRCMHL
jgi:hypothetical protein